MSQNTLTPAEIPEVTVFTEVFADGQRVTALILKYEKDVDGSSITPSTFSVSPGDLGALYASQSGNKGYLSSHGQYIVLEFSPKDSLISTLWKQGEGHSQQIIRKIPSVELRQIKDLKALDGSVISNYPHLLPITNEKNDIVDDFHERQFLYSPVEEVLPYSLYIPEEYNPDKEYPFVVFLHDRGVCSPDFRMGLVQGLGGLVWARGEEQKERECFVLVPHYREAFVNDKFEAAAPLDGTIKLIHSICDEFSIDRERLYGTGQSMGCMALMEIGIRNPELFAGLLLVAGQWNPEKMVALAGMNLWILVAEGDTRAYEGMNSCVSSLESAGTRVKRDFWDGRIIGGEAETLVEGFIDPDFNVYYTIFKDSSVVPPGEFEDEDLPDMLKNHMATWQHVHQIKALRTWLFAQRK